MFTIAIKIIPNEKKLRDVKKKGEIPDWEDKEYIKMPLTSETRKIFR